MKNANLYFGLGIACLVTAWLIEAGNAGHKEAQVQQLKRQLIEQTEFIQVFQRRIHNLETGNTNSLVGTFLDFGQGPMVVMQEAEERPTLLAHPDESALREAGLTNKAAR